MLYVSPFTGERPPPAKVVHLGADDPWTDAVGLENLAMVAEQDTFNMEQVHLGLKNLRRDGVALSRYQESLIRWKHDLLEENIERGPVSS